MKACSFILFFLFIGCSSQEKKPDSIRDPLLAKFEKARQCYHESDSFRDKKPLTLTLNFSISPEGKMKDPRITHIDLKDPNFKSCFITIMSETKFNPSSDGMIIDIKQDFHFYPGPT